MPQNNKLDEELNHFITGLADLLNSIDEIVKKHGNNNTESMKSLIKLQKELTKIKENYYLLLPVYKHDNNQEEILAHSNKFISNCKDAIYNHKSKIMAAPELWNQISSKINNFLEKYLHVRPFKVKDSEYTSRIDSSMEQVQRFQSLKNELHKGKDEEQGLDSEDSPRM